MKLFLKIILLSVLCFQGRAQLLYLQDNFKGGVSVDGVGYYAQEYLKRDTIDFLNTASVGSTIKRAFLVSMRVPWSSPTATDNQFKIYFNNFPVTIDSSDILTEYSSLYPDHLWLVVKDVTAQTLHTGNRLITPNQDSLLIYDPKWHYVYDGFLLVILYEDNSMPNTNIAVFLNDSTLLNNMTIKLNGLNPIDNTKDVGLSISTVDLNIQYPINVVLNSTLGVSNLGSLWFNQAYTLDELLSPGSFYYENNILSGLRNDSPNGSFDSTDALADIKSDINNLTMSFTLSATLHPDNSDYLNAYILAYTTPCPARNIMTEQSYTICEGVGLQLNATPNMSHYTWSYGTTLSNDTISNPIAAPRVGTTNYVVLVDSMGCKHTEHYCVKTFSSPKIDSTTISDAICGDVRGSITVNSAHGGAAPYSYNAGGANQSYNTMGGISSGNHTLTVTDARGCEVKQPFVIIEKNPAIATFSFTPNPACVNEPINFINTSGGAGLQVWNFSSTDTANVKNPTYIFTDTGYFNVTLIVWHNIRSCSDTISHLVFVKDCPPDSIEVIVPNIFSPNDDGINETWQPIVNNLGYDIKEFSVDIFDRWGLKVYESDFGSKQYGWDGHTTSGYECVAGTYYYVIKYIARSSAGIEKKATLKGFIQLVR